MKLFKSSQSAGDDWKHERASVGTTLWALRVLSDPVARCCHVAKPADQPGLLRGIRPCLSGGEEGRRARTLASKVCTDDTRPYIRVLRLLPKPAKASIKRATRRDKRQIFCKSAGYPSFANPAFLHFRAKLSNVVLLLCLTRTASFHNRVMDPLFCRAQTGSFSSSPVEANGVQTQAYAASECLEPTGEFLLLLPSRLAQRYFRICSLLPLRGEVAATASTLPCSSFCNCRAYDFDQPCSFGHSHCEQLYKSESC